MHDDSERQAPGPVDERDVVLPAPRSRADAEATLRVIDPDHDTRPARDTAASRCGSSRNGLDDLRVRIAALVEAVHDLPATGLELDEAQWRVDELAQEINRPYPSPPRVRSRWLRLAPLLRELDAALPVTATGEMIDDAF
ncbi:hypothetical protein ACL03H_11775 [Saccharopolyspora sp. MS10]|uniref:hypothetical protein n=1 Tax=Saccharopolyspora sp. MS10 TaxID=3385973 RepID=UPI0039A1A974